LAQRQPQDTPRNKGQPFHCRKASRYSRHDFHQDDRDTHHRADQGDGDAISQVLAARQRDERQARGAPADSSDRRSDFADRHEHRVAEECGGGRWNRHKRDCQSRGPELRLHRAERGMDQPTPPECVDEPRGRDEIPVEDLEE